MVKLSLRMAVHVEEPCVLSNNLWARGLCSSRPDDLAKVSLRVALVLGRALSSDWQHLGNGAVQQLAHHTSAAICQLGMAQQLAFSIVTDKLSCSL